MAARAARVAAGAAACAIFAGAISGCGNAQERSAPPAVEVSPAPLPSFGSAAAPARAAPAPAKERDEAPLAWERSEPEARARARRENRPLLVFLRADWSVASVELERAIWSDAAVRRAARRFVAVKIDVTDTEADAEFWAQRYGARGIPTTVLVDGEGRTVTTLHGAFAAEELLRALERVD